MSNNSHSEKLSLENNVHSTQNNCVQSDTNVIFVFPKLLPIQRNFDLYFVEIEKVENILKQYKICLKSDSIMVLKGGVMMKNDI